MEMGARAVSRRVVSWLRGAAVMGCLAAPVAMAQSVDQEGGGTVSPMGYCEYCQPDPPPNVAPSVTLTAPTSGQQFVEGSVVTVTANASDYDGSIARVELFVDNVKRGQDTTAPYSFNWTSTVGTHQIIVVAYDNGNEDASDGVSITVNPNKVPTATLTAPTNGQSFVTGTAVTLSATGADTDGSIARIEFLVDGTMVGQDATAPYSYAWTGTAGMHTVTARAVDNLSATGTSAGVSITVNKVPTISITAPTANQQFQSGTAITLSASASDTDGTISRVDFLIDGTKVGQDTTSPYSYAWTSTAGSHSVTAKAYDNLNGVGSSGAVAITVVTPTSPPPSTPPPAPTSFSRTDVITYEDNLSKWVIGQPKTSTNVETGLVESKTDYDPVTLLPVRTYAFGKLQQAMTYNPDGTLASVSDARDTSSYNTTTTFSNWKRGIPQTVAFPDGTSMSAVVDNFGRILSVTDETGAKTCYAYDLMGRIKQITYPSKTVSGICQAPDTSNPDAWNPTMFSFVAVSAPEYGISSGHWKQTVITGNGVKATYFDALWRPVVTESYDAANPSNTRSVSITRYDADSRPVFQSYPVRTLVDYTASNQGTRTTYDAVGRPTRVEQDSELSAMIVTTTEYLSGFKTRVTNPRNKVTTTSYMTYDQPSTDWPVAITHPEGAYTDVVRDTFGKPRMLVRRNADYSQVATRSFVYDDGQRLCKSIEPETGVTVVDYDPAGNLAWSAAGLALPNTDNSACASDRNAAYASGRRSDRTYDQRSRLQTLIFPDGRGSQTWEYWNDGKTKKIVTANDGGNPVENTYEYNSRRLLTYETTSQPGWYTWGLSYGYDANGALSRQTSPTGLTLTYSPNGLGQPTSVRDTWNLPYATNISYYPNGAIQQFTYGNGITHTMTQNARQLPARVTDNWGAMDYAYGYDANGNPTVINDYAQGGNYSRAMTYDGLDRLITANSCSFGGDCWHRFTYDTLDNIRSWKLAGVKDYADYYYEPDTNRLINIRNSAGLAVVGLGYDLQGNLTNKNGQGYEFDYANRLRTVYNKEFYRYDGHGRRAMTWRQPGYVMLNMYANNGQLAYQYDESKAKSFDNIYLAGSLVAIIEYRHPDWASTTKFQHTDALGSPVAVSDANGFVIDRTQYEPYGAAIGKPTYDGIGYTGHVMDGATGLTYMQQRYYDPAIGRFLSVDPVTANAATGENFNRYKYASNNPYKLRDPDGRQDAKCGTGSNPCTDLIPKIERNPMPVVNAIVLHRTGGSTAAGAINTWKSPSNKANIGAHYVIDRDGKTTQTASTSKTTNHVGKIRSRSEGEGQRFDPSGTNRTEQAKAYPDRYPTNSDSIGIEVVGAFNARTGLFDPATAAQLDALNALVGSLQQQFNLTDSDVYRHGDISYKQPSEGQGLGYDPP